MCVCGGGGVELFQPARGRVCVWGEGGVELFQPARGVYVCGGGRGVLSCFSRLGVCMCVWGEGGVELFQPARGRVLRVATEPISTRAPYSAQQRRRRPAKQRLLPSSVHHCSQPEPDTLRDPLPPLPAGHDRGVGAGPRNKSLLSSATLELGCYMLRKLSDPVMVL